MPPTRRRSAAPDPDSLAAVQQPGAPRLSRAPEVDPVLAASRAPAPDTPPQPDPEQQTPPARAKPKVVRFQSYVTPELAEQVRDAVAWLGGRWTTGTVMQRALEAEVQRLAEEYNDGRPFPTREDQELRRGPRV